MADRNSAAVDVRGLVKVFGVTPALVGVDLLVPRGTVCGLLGGNGAGKTTLLRCVATALRPTQGTVSVLGHDSSRRPTDIRKLTDLVPTAGGAYPDMTARENVQFSLAMRGCRLRKERIDEALLRAGLQGVGDELVRTYSSGMVRRLALARVLLTRPPLLLLDEPYAALDEEGRELVDDVLADARRDGRSVLIATHDRVRIAARADAVVQLDRGALAGELRLSAGAVTQGALR